jgi:hypothetical protein
MNFISFSEGMKGYLFIRLPNNTLFTAATAIFDEEMFPKCLMTEKHQFTPVGEEPARDQIPSNNEEQQRQPLPLLRKSMCEQKIPLQPGNVYGE